MLCWGNSDVPFVEFTLEEVCDASEQQVQWIIPIMCFTLSVLKSHAAFRKAVRKNNVQVGWEFSVVWEYTIRDIWAFLFFFALFN